MTTALEQQREDAALGAAWRRCEAALPEDWANGPTLFGYDVQDSDRFYIAYVEGPRASKYRRGLRLEGNETTPTAALEALADALEARKAAE